MRKFDPRGQRAARDVTANVASTDLLVAKANHAATDLRATVLPVIDHRAMVKVAHHVKVKAVVLAMAKDDLQKDVIRDVDAAKDLRDKGLRAVPWDHRILNASWKTRCVSMPTLMES
jgi:hypothetical protein